MEASGERTSGRSRGSRLLLRSGKEISVAGRGRARLARDGIGEVVVGTYRPCSSLIELSNV